MGPSSAWNRLRRALPYRDGAIPAGNPWHTLGLLVRRLGLVVLLLGLLRLVFWFLYRTSFGNVPPGQVPQVLLQGLRFDVATVVIWNAPLILLFLLPVRWRDSRAGRRVFRTGFMLINGLLLAVCCIDLIYFGFNHKRVGRDLLGQLGAGTRNLPSFLADHGWVAAVFILLLVVLWRAARGTPGHRPAPPRPWLEIPVALGVLGLCLLLGRGGWQYQGISPAHAADHVDVAFAPLVTNSAFTLVHSLGQPVVEQRHWFSQDELDRRMPLRYAIRRDPGDRKENVVLIIVESLGQEYLASLSGAPAYMPFLDSLAGHSLVFDRAFANAERSNKSFCAILAGIPSFTDEAFMNTPYAANRLDGLGTRMKQAGYATSFFHGGINGEYKFDSFSRAAGFDRYYGRDEYPDPAGYDGHWGIYDEEFLQFFADRLDREQVPFCSAVFTLSSHHPFLVPDKWKGRFPKGTQEIHESLGYADMALRRFFGRAARSPWYRNTLFVITGDHTFLYNAHPAWYMNAAGRFAVPILFFRPDGSLNGRDHAVAQHLDILPSILDITGFQGEVNTFGRSLFKRDREPYAVQYLNGQYQWISADRLLFFDGERATGLYAYRTDTLFHQDLTAAEPDTVTRLRERLEAVIQRHAWALDRNALLPPAPDGQP